MNAELARTIIHYSREGSEQLERAKLRDAARAVARIGSTVAALAAHAPASVGDTVRHLIHHGTLPTGGGRGSRGGGHTKHKRKPAKKKPGKRGRK
jgi:hypothetical protein